MALNEIFRDADSLSYNMGNTDPEISSGEFVTLSATAPGNLWGVAETDAELRADGNYWVTVRHVGVFEGTTTVTGAIARGANLYITAASAPSALAVTNDAASGANFLIGKALEAKGTTSGTVPIKVRVNN
jgi:predicted RecA/RadA family phage recombinase